jgi:hypothetical protein
VDDDGPIDPPANRLERLRENLRQAFPVQLSDFPEQMKALAENEAKKRR